MTLTFAQLIAIQEPLQRLARARMEARAAFKVGVLVKLLAPHMAAASEARPSLRCSTTAMSRNSRETAQIGPSSGSSSALTTLAKLLQGHSATCGVKPHFGRVPSGNFAKGRSVISMA